MPIHCPHCQNTIEVTESPPPAEIVCTACGSSFRLDPGQTAAWMPAEAPKRLGRFEFLEQLGVGAFGTVYKARDTELARLVAIKIPRTGDLSQTDLDRFLREARSAAQLKHPGIVAVHDAGQGDGTFYLVSEFVQGATLADRLTAGRLGFRQSAELIAQVADALQYAHERGVIHRDIKPSNIMLETVASSQHPVASSGGQNRSATGYCPKIMDFGLAKRAADEITMTLEGQVLGTPAYLSPEAARGEVSRIEARSDIYSLGVVLYELLTGELPFRGNARMLIAQVIQDEPRPPRRLNDHIPRDLETICLKAMAKEPARRYGTAREMADDLRRFLAGEPILARPVAGWERVWRWAKRRPAVAGFLAASAVAVLALVGVAVALLFNTRLQRALDETERLRYFLNIARAHAEYQGGNMGLVEPLLDDCPAQHCNWEWHYLKRLCHLDVLTFEGYGPQDYRLKVAFHPDGKLLAAAGPKGTVMLWDVNTGKANRTFTGHTGVVIGIAFSPDGTRLASAAMDQTVRIWDVMTGNPIHRLEVRVSAFGIGAVAFSPDGQRLALASENSFVQIWNAKTGREMAPLCSQDAPVRCVAFSYDGTQIATGSSDVLHHTVKLWDAATGALVCTLTETEQDWVNSVAFSPDGKRLVSTSDWAPKIWDLASGKVGLTLKGHSGGVLRVAFSPDGHWLATGSIDQSIKLWHTATGEMEATFRGHAGGITDVAFSPDGTRLASVSRDYTVKVWDTRASREVRTLADHTHGVECVTFSPEGARLASGSTDQTVKVWDVKTGRDTRTLKGHSGQVLCVAFSPDGTRLASGGEDRTVKIWDATTAQEIHTLRGHTDVVHSVSFTPDGARLASASSDRTMRLWDTVTGQEVRTLSGHTGSVQGVTFSPDGKWLASGSYDSTLKLWNGTTGQEIRTFQVSASQVCCVAFSPDGTHLASGFVDNTLKVWDVATGRELRTLTGHTARVWCVTFSPDGKRLASSSYDGTVKLWDMESGQELITLKGHTSIVTGVAFSPDGTWIASASGDRTIKLWDGRPWEPRKVGD